MTSRTPEQMLRRSSQEMSAPSAMFRPTADRLRRPSAKLRDSDGHQSRPKRVLCASWETSAPTTTLTALLGTPCATRDPKRGRYWDRTSDLCRVKVSGGHFARLENRRDTATGLVSHGFRTLSVVRWFSVVLSVMWTRCGRRPVEVSVPCVPVTPTALSSGVGSTERPVEASMSADMGAPSPGIYGCRYWMSRRRMPTRPASMRSPAMPNRMSIG
jgi:hypothetical protein